jgi:hypothetical protein
MNSQSRAVAEAVAEFSLKSVVLYMLPGDVVDLF